MYYFFNIPEIIHMIEAILIFKYYKIRPEK